jgi:hypothetical protein
MKLAIKKDCDRSYGLYMVKIGYAFRFENGGLFLFCSWISQREIGIPVVDWRIVLCDHSIIC